MPTVLQLKGCDNMKLYYKNHENRIENARNVTCANNQG